MHPSKLIGKKALRTKAAVYAHGLVSRSFLDNPCTILAVTKSHMLNRFESPVLQGNETILSYEYIDDNWTAYDDLMKRVEPKFPAKQISILRKWLNSLLKRLQSLKLTLLHKYFKN